MKVRFTSENEIIELVRSFEEATIAREAWGHAEHLTVGLYYLMHHETEVATGRMRDGIFNLLTKGFSVDLTKEMPYHETLTVFWMRTIAEFSSSSSNVSLLEKANSLVEVFDKNYPLRFYSREVLFSEDARKEFIEGDLPITTSAFSASRSEQTS